MRSKKLSPIIVETRAIHVNTAREHCAHNVNLNLIYAYSRTLQYSNVRTYPHVHEVIAARRLRLDT